MWPQSLVAELASRRCIIFLGAGASAGCLTVGGNPTSPPTWLQLLTGLKEIVLDQSILPTVDVLINKEKYLDAAEVLMGKINRADFAAFMRRVLATPRYQPSEIHNAVLELDPKIVITTNYDDIYDAFCRAGQGQELYNVCKYYESHLVSDLRSPVRQIVKAHGCITDPSKIVLTRSQYFRERQEHPNFYKGRFQAPSATRLSLSSQ